MNWIFEGEDAAAIVVIGVGATLMLDLFAALRARLTGSPGMNWGKVGRWLGHLPRGHLTLTGPIASVAIPGEVVMGWAFHYGVGIALTAVMTVVLGTDWLGHPPFFPVVGFGVLTVTMPMLTLQPALGMGLAARHAALPWLVRRNSLITHFVFGIGLFLSAVLLNGLKEAI